MMVWEVHRGNSVGLRGLLALMWNLAAVPREMRTFEEEVIAVRVRGYLFVTRLYQEVSS